MHLGHGAPPTTEQCLVDRHVPDMSSRGHTLPRQCALHVLHCRVLEQRADLTMGPTILGRRRPRKPPKQGRHGSDVLVGLDEVWEGFIVFDDPLVHVAGHDARTPAVSMALDLSLEFLAFLLELESCFLVLLALGLQLLYP